MKRNYRNRDPYWLSAKYAGKCAKCSAPIKKGDKAFYYPNNRTIYGGSCGCADDASADFSSIAFDEAVYNY